MEGGGQGKSGDEEVKGPHQGSSEEKEPRKEQEDEATTTSSGSNSATSESSSSSDEEEEEEEEEEEGLRCSLVVEGQRRCSGQLTAAAHALRFVPHSDPDHVYEVEYGRVTWAGWQASERGSRGENCGFLHVEVDTTAAVKDARKDQRRGKARRGEGVVDRLAHHSFAHFVAGGPRAGRNPRLRALVADIKQLSASALGTAVAPTASTSSNVSARAVRNGPRSTATAAPSPRVKRQRRTIVIDSDGDDVHSEEEEEARSEDNDEADQEEEEEEESELGGIRVERVGHGDESMVGVVRGGHGMCRVHLTPSAIVQLDRRPFIVVPYREIEVACLERALFSTLTLHSCTLARDDLSNLTWERTLIALICLYGNNHTEPALRNFDLALVKKSVWQHAPEAQAKTKAKSKRKRRTTKRNKSKSKNHRREDDEDDDDEDDDAIERKNLSRYVAQIHSIPMEHLARLESRLTDEAVPHHRGLANVQWPQLLNFVRDNPDEFARTGGWDQYLKPEHDGGKGGRRRRTSSDDSDDGAEGSDDDSGSEGDLWKPSGGDGDGSEEESDGEFTPEAGLLNASYSEIDDADDADSPRRKRKRQRSADGARDIVVSSTQKAPRKRRAALGLTALLLQVSDDDDNDVHPMPVKKKEKRTTTKRAKKSMNAHELKTKGECKTGRGGGRKSRKDVADDDDEEQLPMKKKRRKQAEASTTTEEDSTKARKRKPDERTIKAAKTSTRKRAKKTEAAVPERSTASHKAEEDEEEFEPKAGKAKSSPSASSLAVKALNERVRQQRFSGYNTRSSRGAKPASGPQDKIIRIDPPPTRRKRRTSATATDESRESSNPEVPQGMKAEAEAVELRAALEVPMRPSAVAAGHRSSCTSEDANFSFSGDESASSSLDCHGYESEGSVFKRSTASSPATSAVTHSNLMDSPGAGAPVGLHHQNAQ